MPTERTDRAWFSRFLLHPARKWSGSILTIPEPAQGARVMMSILSHSVGWYMAKQTVDKNQIQTHHNYHHNHHSPRLSGPQRTMHSTCPLDTADALVPYKAKPNTEKNTK